MSSRKQNPEAGTGEAHERSQQRKTLSLNCKPTATQQRRKTMNQYQQYQQEMLNGIFGGMTPEGEELGYDASQEGEVEEVAFEVDLIDNDLLLCTIDLTEVPQVGSVFEVDGVELKMVAMRSFDPECKMESIVIEYVV